MPHYFDVTAAKRIATVSQGSGRAIDTLIELGYSFLPKKSDAET